MKMINESIINKNQNNINYLNADIMFEELDYLIKKYGSEFILKEVFRTEKECIKNYVLKSNAIRLACDVCEHYIKAMLIDMGKTWNEMKAIGHNLIYLLENLDEKNRKLIVSNILPLQTDILNLTEEEQKIVEYMMHIPNTNIEGITLKAEKYYKNENLEKEEKKQLEVITSRFVFDDINEMFKKNDSKNKTMTIKARYPGEYLIKEDAKMVISLAYTLNKINKNKINT